MNSLYSMMPSLLSWLFSFIKMKSLVYVIIVNQIGLCSHSLLKETRDLSRKNIPLVRHALNIKHRIYINHPNNAIHILLLSERISRSFWLVGTLCLLLTWCVTIAQAVLDLLSLCVSLPRIVSMSDNMFFLSYVGMARNREVSGSCRFFLCTKQH